MAQIGKCSNRVGCTLAYTGQEIRFEGSPICPECGQPLTQTTKPKKSSKLWILILIPIVLLAIAAIGFYGVERYLAAVDAAKATPTPSPSATATPAVAQNQSPTEDQSGEKMVEGKSQVPADVLNKANNQSSPSPTSQPASSAASPSVTPAPVTQQSPPAAQESPEPNNGGNPPQPGASPANGKSPPAGQASPDNLKHENPSAQKSPDSEGDNSGQTVDSKPKELSTADVEATKQDVLKRIAALPKMSESEKSKLADKVETARSMQRVGVVYFPTGSNVLSKESTGELVSLFKDPKLVEKMSDPTLVFIVAGYADRSGDARANLKLSDERAEAVANALSESAGVINLVRTVGMGGTELLSNRRADQNRAVEIWAVVP
jgi:outer membrane protein OmpA-like peptidoglycan-associated protein